MHYVDLTQTIVNAMPVFPGDALPQLQQSASLESDGTTNYVLTSSMHVGTHVDGPVHMIPRGKRLMDFPAETFFGRAVIIDARGKKEISEELLHGMGLERDAIVLVCTGWAEHFGKPNYYKEYPAVTEGFASALVAAGVKMFGSDSPSPDYPPFPVHKRLLSDNILIVENLTGVDKLVGASAVEVIVLPLKIAADSAPARAVARIA